MNEPNVHPASSVITLDVTDDTRLAADVDALDIETRARLNNALDRSASNDREREIIRIIRETLAAAAAANPDEYMTPVIGVRFSTMEYDNGYFLTEEGQVLLADGTVTDCDFTINDEFTERYGCVGRDFVLAVDLRESSLDEDDYGSNASIHECFGVSLSQPAWRAEDPTTEAWWREHGGLPDDLTIDGLVFSDASNAIGYLALKALPVEHVLYLARSNGQQLKNRKDTVYCRVATEATDPQWVIHRAARVAFTHGWIELDEYTRLTS
jgi:hypothetical protein